MPNQDFRVKNGLKVGITSDETYVFTITSDGKVGVGSEVPKNSLDVTGSGNIDGFVSIGGSVTASSIFGSGIGLTSVPSEQLTGLFPLKDCLEHTTSIFKVTNLAEI